MIRRVAMIFFAFATGLNGCSDPFDPGNLIQTPRLLALRANPADGIPGETLTFDALVEQYQETTAPTYAWSWCPITGAGSAGFPCLFSHTQLQGLVDGFTVPDYDLGTQSTATLALDSGLTAAMRALCSAIDQGQAPGINASIVPSCRGRIAISIFLTVQWPQRMERALQTVPVLLMDEPMRNRHPTAGTTDPLALAHNSEAEIQLEGLLESDAETYSEQLIGETAPRTRSEDLTLTWFVTGGETLFERTTYVKDDSAFATFTSNTWTTPSLAEAAEVPPKLILVLRDNRGGITWWERPVLLHE